MTYSTYIFDFDGTLVDSMPTYAALMLRILDESGTRYGDDVIKIITPLGYRGAAKYFIEHLGISLTEQEILSRIDRYAYEAYAYHIPANAHVRETLEALAAAGAGLHVLTASPHKVLDVCLRRLGLFDLFGNVWSCEDFGTTKSDPAIYRAAAARIGRPVGDILFLDDNYNADKTAAEAGMKVCGVYDPSSAAFADDIRRVAHHYITDFAELTAL